MPTGKHLKIKSLGDAVLGVVLEGNPRKPEPDSFRVHFPGGCVEIARCSDGLSYWVHTVVDTPEKLAEHDPESGKPPARITEARLHIDGRHSGEVDLGDFDNKYLYDCALKVELL